MKTYLKQTIGLSVLCLVMIAGGYPVWAQTKQTAEQELPEAAINEDRVWKPRAVEIEVSTPDPLPVFNPPSNSYRKDLLTAMDYHNMANAVQAMIDSNDYRDTLVDLALVERRMSDLEKCNVNLLSKNFSDPQNVWNKMKATPEDDNRGLGQWLLEETPIKNKLLETEPAKLAKATGKELSKMKDGIGNGYKNALPRPVRNSIRGAVTVAGKGAAYAIPRAGKLYAKGVLGATAGLVGVAAGLATGDDMNILKYGGTGVAAGIAAGSASDSMARNISQGIQDVSENIASTYTTARGGQKAEKERQQAIADRAAMRDKERQKKYMEKLKVSREEMKQVMKDYQEYRKSGITDDNVIIGAMKANKQQFGESRANRERIILAGLANEVGKDNKKIKDLESRLKERGLSDDDVNKFIGGIREINEVV